MNLISTQEKVAAMEALMRFLKTADKSMLLLERYYTALSTLLEGAKISNSSTLADLVAAIIWDGVSHNTPDEVVAKIEGEASGMRYGMEGRDVFPAVITAAQLMQLYADFESHMIVNTEEEFLVYHEAPERIPLIGMGKTILPMLANELEANFTHKAMRPEIAPRMCGAIVRLMEDIITQAEGLPAPPYKDTDVPREEQEPAVWLHYIEEHVKVEVLIE